MGERRRHCLAQVEVVPGKKYNQKSNLAKDMETKIAPGKCNFTLPSLLLDLLGEPSALFGVEHAQWQVGTANDIGAITIKL